MSKSPRRRTNLIDPETQLSLLKRISFHWLSFIVANSVALITWVVLFESEPGSSWGDVSATFVQRYAPFLLISIALLPIFLRDTLKLSNRFAGPIARLRRAMNGLADGSHVAPISFRKGDFMQDIAADFNQVLARCDSKYETTAPSKSSESSDDVRTDTQERELVSK